MNEFSAQIDQHIDDREDENDGLDHEVVTFDGTSNDEPPHAGPRKELFDDYLSPQQQAELEPEHHDDGDHGVAGRVAEPHRLRLEPLRVRKAHELLLLDLDGGGPSQA